MTRVLVTGAGGFLGASLINELGRAGFGVRALLRDLKRTPRFPPEVETVEADVRDGQAIKEATVGCEAVVHLAAKVHAIDERGSDQDYDAINVEGTRHVLDAAVASGATRVVFASSVKVFGEETEGCVDETCQPHPLTPYGRSKWRAEQLLSEYSQQGRLTAVSLRLPMVYGPTEKGNLYRMIQAIDSGRFPPLPPLPGLRSLLHVGNFVQAVIACLRARRFQQGAYIVTDAQPYNLTAIYDWLRAALGKPLPMWRVPLWILKGGARIGDILQTVTGQSPPLTSDQLGKLIGSAWYSPEAIGRDLGYRAIYSFEQTVPELVSFYRGAAR